MRLEVTPEPSPEERTAIERALRAALARPATSDWRRAALEPEPGDDDVPQLGRSAAQRE